MSVHLCQWYCFFLIAHLWWRMLISSMIWPSEWPTFWMCTECLQLFKDPAPMQGKCDKMLEQLGQSLWITIDKIWNQLFIMGCTSCQWPVMLVNACGKRIQIQKAFDYKKLDTQLQILRLGQHSFRVRVRIWIVAVLGFVTSRWLNCYALYLQWVLSHWVLTLSWTYVCHI